jgi:prephenate dehydrogenase
MIMEVDGFGFKFDFNVAIVGLGLIGGSYAKALRELKPKKIFGIDLDKASLDNALKAGVIDEGYTNGDTILKKSDLIIIALYPCDTIKFIKDNVQNIKQYAVITDTCGLKELITEEMLDILPETIEFVGGHPMAGKESKGFLSSS